MNQGGEPGHDDYGLPRVDIQIPDDARELYREVQAYHRELRALRRQERSRRWGAPLRRSGMILPVIAGFLVLAMIAGMILTMFSANPNFSEIAGPLQTRPGPTQRTSGPSAGSEQASRSVVATATGAANQPWRLPAKTIIISPRTRVYLPRLTATALAIIPARCRCVTAIKRFIEQAMTAGVQVYLVGTRGSTIKALSSLAPAWTRSTAVLAIDAENALHSAYRPHSLEILLVDSRGSVTVTSEVRPASQIERQLERLKPPG